MVREIRVTEPELTWDLRDHQDVPVANGVYFFRVRTEDGLNFVRRVQTLR